MTLNPYSDLESRPEGSAPVFVDTTGRRRRRVRRIAYLVGAACLTYTGLVAASAIGHTARPGGLALLPSPMTRSQPAVRRTLPPPPPATSAAPRPIDDARRPEDVSMGLHWWTGDRPSAPRPQRAAAPRTSPTQRRTPTVAPPAPTKSPSRPSPEPTGSPNRPSPEPTQPAPGVTDEPGPVQSDQPEPQPTGSPAAEPTPGATPEATPPEPSLIGQILDLTSAWAQK